MPDERQPGQGAPMWPTDDEDRGAASSPAASSGNKPAEPEPEPDDQGKPKAATQPLWPTDDDEPAQEPPAPEPPAEADGNKPAESPDADEPPADEPAAAEVNKPAESEDTGQDDVDEGHDDTVRVAAEDISRSPSGSEDTVRVAAENLKSDPPEKPAEPPKPDDEPAEQVDDIKPAESPEPDEPAGQQPDGIKPAESEAPEEPKPAEPAEPAERAEEAADQDGGIKPAESEEPGQQGERLEASEFATDERRTAERIEAIKAAWFFGEDREVVDEPPVIKPAEREDAAQRVEGIKPAESVWGEERGRDEDEEEPQSTADLRIDRREDERAERAEQERAEQERAEQERAEQERVERERADRERAEQERAVQERAEQERVEQERVERERAERERAERERAERERVEQERVERERAERERAERERAERERAERERAERERAERERTERDHGDGEDTQTVAAEAVEQAVQPEQAEQAEQAERTEDVEEDDGEQTQRVTPPGEQPTLLRRYVEDTQVIDLHPVMPERRPGTPPPSSPLQRPQQQRPQGPQRQGPSRPSGPPPGRVIPPVGPPRARPMRIEPRTPAPESPAERTEMIRLPEPPPHRELPVHRERLQRMAAEEPAYDDLYDRLYDDDDEDDDRPIARRRSRKGLIITLVSVVVVLAVAAGVVFTVPGLATKLGLKGGKDVAIAPPPQPVAFTPQLKGPNPQAPNPTPSGVERALASSLTSPSLGTLTGIVIDPADGTALWDRSSSTELLPASTGKILTSAAALLSLDHTTQFVTRVVQGDQPGTVVLVGGGDLTLNSLPPGEDSVYPGSAHVADLIAQVKKATGGNVTKVLVDVHRYSGPLLAPGWDPADVAAGYETPMEPVMMDGGRADPTEPEKSTRSSRPARAVATKIADALGATVPDNATTTAKANATVLGEVRSAPLVEMIDNLLQISDNMLAEGVLREVAKQNGEEVSYAGGVRAVKKVLQDNGFDVSGYRMVDGSGLSTQDKATAKLLADVLAVAAGPDGKDPRTAKLRPLLGGLPVAGGSGTLNPRFHDAESSEGKGWVRAKTGTLTGVNTLAGVVLDQDGRVLVFALMSNNGNGATTPPALDAIAARLRECGCG